PSPAPRGFSDDPGCLPSADAHDLRFPGSGPAPSGSGRRARGASISWRRTARGLARAPLAGLALPVGAGPWAALRGAHLGAGGGAEIAAQRPHPAPGTARSAGRRDPSARRGWALDGWRAVQPAARGGAQRNARSLSASPPVATEPRSGHLAWPAHAVHP